MTSSIKLNTTVVPVVVIGAVDVVGTERVVAVNEENSITYTSKAHAWRKNCGTLCIKGYCAGFVVSKYCERTENNNNNKRKSDTLENLSMLSC